MPEEDRVEEHCHPDHSRRHELQIAAMTGLAKDGAQSKAQSEQIQAWLSERDDYLHARADVSLQIRAARECIWRPFISTSLASCRSVRRVCGLIAQG